MSVVLEDTISVRKAFEILRVNVTRDISAEQEVEIKIGFVPVDGAGDPIPGTELGETIGAVETKVLSLPAGSLQEFLAEEQTVTQDAVQAAGTAYVTGSATLGEFDKMIVALFEPYLDWYRLNRFDFITD